jgi:hypothetical protein
VKKTPSTPSTLAVSDKVFKQVYDAPSSLPGRYKWLTPDEDVRAIEKLLHMPSGTIGAPLWVSGERKTCTHCRRTISWLDIVASSLKGIHDSKMIAQVILGDQKYVNTEAPRAIEKVNCFKCSTPFLNLRSFKCHNWAYAKPKMLKIFEIMEKRK